MGDNQGGESERRDWWEGIRERKERTEHGNQIVRRGLQEEKGKESEAEHGIRRVTGGL